MIVKVAVGCRLGCVEGKLKTDDGKFIDCPECSKYETETNQYRERLVEELVSTKTSLDKGIIHACAENKGLIIDGMDDPIFYSYNCDDFNWRLDEDGSFLLRRSDQSDWRLVYNHSLGIIIPASGLHEELGNSVRFWKEYREGSVTLNKAIIMLALFRDGVDVQLALGRRRVGMIRRREGNNEDFGIDALELRRYEKIRRLTPIERLLSSLDTSRQKMHLEYPETKIRDFERLRKLIETLGGLTASEVDWLVDRTAGARIAFPILAEEFYEWTLFYCPRAQAVT